eukprot:5362520-Amphidinium_carterae.1
MASNSFKPSDERALLSKEEMEVKLLDDPGIESSFKALWGGKTLRTLQNFVKSTRQYGLSVKFKAGANVAGSKPVVTEYSFRVATLEDRER